MPHCSDTITPSRFEARVSPGQHSLAFKVAFGSDAAAARYFKVSRMAIWRWRHDRTALPRCVAEILTEIMRDRLRDVLAAQQHLKWFLDRPPAPPRKLSGCCAGHERKPRRHRPKN